MGGTLDRREPPRGLRARGLQPARRDRLLRPAFRADHVGRLLRPGNLLHARVRHTAGESDDAERRGGPGLTSARGPTGEWNE